MGLLLNHTLLFMLSSVEIPEQPKLVSATENSITLSFNKPDDKQIFIYCDKFKNVFSQTTSTHSIWDPYDTAKRFLLKYLPFVTW